MDEKNSNIPKKESRVWVVVPGGETRTYKTMDYRIDDDKFLHVGQQYGANNAVFAPGGWLSVELDLVEVGEDGEPI